MRKTASRRRGYDYGRDRAVAAWQLDVGRSGDWADCVNEDRVNGDRANEDRTVRTALDSHHTSDRLTDNTLGNVGSTGRKGMQACVESATG